MASINSLSSSTNSALGSLRGYGGLASGLDRDTLIEGMTAGTQTKINKQEKAKTTLQWQMDAYREISDKMISFADKYTSTMTSSTNLFSDSLWGAASTIVNGVNSKFVSVSGSSNKAANVAITAIKQLAKNASVSNKSAVSDRTLKTGAIDLGNVKMSTLGGKDIEITIGDTSYTIDIPYGDGNLTDAKSVADAINKAAGDVDVQLGNKTYKLSEFVKAGTVDGDDLTFGLVTGMGNKVSITGGSALKQMGIEEDTELTGDGPSFKVITADKLFETQDFATRMGGKELTFNYNGTSKTIKLPTADEIKKSGSTGEQQLEYVKKALQDQLDSSFGKGRVEVKVEDTKDASGKDTKQLTFKTMNPGTKAEDVSSTLTVTGGSAALLGKNGGLGIAKGESNRINLSASLKDSGLASNVKPDADGNYNLKINGVDIKFSENDTVNDIMKKINDSKAGVTLSYMSTADKFIMTSKEDGTGGNITMSGTGAELLFGSNDIDTSKAGSDADAFSATAGQDAIAMVKYAGSDEEIELVRGSNNFDLEGLNVSLKGTFGYKDDGSGNTVRDKDAEEITFTANVDTEKIVTAITDLVKEYNEIVELVNKQMSTRPDKDYYPLTSDQKSEMSEKEIELWENKAKEGILYGSSELRGLASDLRFTLSAEDQIMMKEFGLSVSSSWADNGKLVLDESKLKAALETNLEGVREAFTKTANAATGARDGFATNLKNTMDKYVGLYGDTKGILIEKAGSTKSPTSVLDNEILSQMNDIDKLLDTLKTRLSSEQDRYIKQFTQLETLISQMNSQSSYLSSLGF